MMNREFTCDLCGVAFEAGWSEEEAAAEAKELWGIDDVTDKDEVGVCCNDCFVNFVQRSIPPAPIKDEGVD
jgi:hypothetical protein